ncbi:MAG: hypothetical protein ACRC8A_00675 [Microcoleaceae cyanobacterium]
MTQPKHPRHPGTTPRGKSPAAYALFARHFCFWFEKRIGEYGAQVKADLAQLQTHLDQENTEETRIQIARLTGQLETLETVLEVFRPLAETYLSQER